MKNLSKILFAMTFMISLNCFATQYHVVQSYSNRNGYESDQPSRTYTSETYGNTTYYQQCAPSPRKGYAN